ncbi:MAG: right-handed parallel beta-helix repeat-containing protein [Prevotella sp.]|nr:right-handed parallel beta-helix repeat-containing protein [Prevotella sp.]
MKKILFLIMMCLTPGVMCAGDVYVSPSGSDTNSGLSQQEPVKTMRTALRIAREWRRLNNARIQGGVVIHLAKGNYEPFCLRTEDSGTDDSPTIIRGDEGATVGLGVSVGTWRQEGGLLVADVPQQYINRQMWTTAGKAYRASLFGPEKMGRMTDFNTSDRTITIPVTGRDLGNSPDLEMTVHQRWALAILRIDRTDIQGGLLKVSFREPESTLEFDHPWPQPVIGGEKGNSSYNLWGAKAFLDEPGEWYYDKLEKKLYYYPRDGETTDNLKAVVPTGERLLTIEGCDHEQVRNRSIEYITFEYAAWNRPSQFGHVTLQAGFAITEAYKLKQEGLPWAPTLENQAWIERPVSAVCVRYADRINFRGCTFRHLAATALDYEYATNDAVIENNHFEDIGGTAIMVGSFSEGAFEVHRPFKGLCSDNVTIRNNNIYDISNEDWGTVGIGCGYVSHCTISANRLERMNYCGICVGWGWTPHLTGMHDNRIVDNIVTDFARQLYDAGGIYTMSNQPNSLIEGNTITRLCDAPYATNERGFYIYLDAETDGYTITGNTCDELRFGDNHPGPNVIWKDNNKSDGIDR